MTDDLTKDLRTLMLQIQAGITLLEEVMDDEVGGDWVKPYRGETVPGRYAWGQLSIAWINLGSMLMRDPAVEAWTIPPLVSRSPKGEVTSLEFSPGGHVEINAWDGGALDLRHVPEGTVRVVHEPSEPKYTLEEARQLLEICQQHHWEVELDDNGRPVGVMCSTTGCEERRPLR